MSTSIFPSQLYYRFPWLNGSSTVLFQDLGIFQEDLEKLDLQQTVRTLFAAFPILPERIMAFFHAAMDNTEQFTTPTDDNPHLAMYPLLKILIGMLKNRILANSFANMYAKDCQTALEGHRGKENHTNKVVQQLCQNIGIDCSLHEKNFLEKSLFPFQMSVGSYLAVSTKISNDAWKLINRKIVNGKVNLIRHDMILLLREFVRIKIKPNIHEIDDSLSISLSQIPEIRKIMAQMEVLILQNTKRFQSSILSGDEKVGSDLFAPCIKVILHKASQGENLNHNERLAIAFYFLNTNHTIEETVDIFRTSPDFDESIARYQVEFVAGKGGKGTKYKMYRCNKMKSLSMCYADHPDFGDVLCVKGSKKRNGEHVTIQNPATDYIFWKRVEINRNEREQKYLAEQDRRKKASEDAQNTENAPSNPPKQSSPSPNPPSSNQKPEEKPL